MKKIALSLCLILFAVLLVQGGALDARALAAGPLDNAAQFVEGDPAGPSAGGEGGGATSDAPEEATTGDSAATEPEPPADPATDPEPDVTPTAQQALEALAAEREILALVYLSDKYTVRTAADGESVAVVSVPSGQQVQIQAVETNEAGEAWARVRLTYKDVVYEGYVLRKNLACSDERFLAWEQENGINQQPMRRARTMMATAASFADVEQFPESYRAALTALKNAHPNWTFVKMETGLDWNTVVHNEINPRERSLIYKTYPDYMKDGLYGTNWYYASEAALKYYLDPRNWLNDEYIFQFELLTYNESYHTEAAVQSFLNGSFMQGEVPGTGRSYAGVFWDIGREFGVSPFHLASRVYQEQGKDGASRMISGDYPGYEGLYNHFNVGAAGSTNEAIMTSGLTYARNKGWNSPYNSLRGGADLITQFYVRKGQDTLYLQKFDVEPNYNGLYWHQYQQSVYAPSTEGRQIRNLYESAGSLNSTFVFKIPVYNNMPASACLLPAAAYEVALTPPAGYTDNKIFLDGAEYAAENRGGQLVVNPGGTSAQTAVMYKYNEAGIPIGMYVWTLAYRNGSYAVTAVPEFEDLLTYHGFSVRITGKTGIRFKTGLAIDKRNSLTGGGLAGYTLKEYGTLVMTNANRSQYPMVKGGTKVNGGVSYGTNSSGNFVDFVYESVNGRYRYTSVLVGLPATEYKTEFAFRGYITLSRDGADITLYGPPVARSIYALAQQVLADGDFAEGTEAHTFLTGLVQAAG